MTFSNTGFSAHPLANPFNCRVHGNYNMAGFGYGRKSSVRLDSNAKLPEAKPYEPPKSLEVPNQLGAELGVSRLDTVGLSQMFPGLVTCPDGTMLDFKTGKVVVDPNRGAQPGEWAKTKVISPPQAVASAESWNNDYSSMSLTSRGGSLNTRDSEEYWRAQAAAEQAKQPKMSDAQKKMLADLESGKIMKLSRLELVDESKKEKNQSKPV